MANQNASNDDQPDQSAAETARLNRYAAIATSTSTTNANPQTTSVLPGRRLKNPLGEFPSYTYQLTLYMVSPDAYGLFVASGRKNINATNLGRDNTVDTGVFIVAQNGGLNRNDKTQRRVPGMQYDYYIDQLKITQAVSAKANQATSNTTSIEFNIYEPYGFSFPSQLNRGFEAIKQASNTKGYDSDLNEQPTKSFFILGIRFQGYDSNGVPVNAATTFSSDTLNPSIDANGNPVPSQSNGVFERYIDLELSELKFALNGSTTVYKIKGNTRAPNVAFGNKYGRVNINTVVVGGTVEEALKGSDNSLIAALNKNQQGRSIPIQYKLEFIGNENDVARIKNASLINPGDPNKQKFQINNVKNSSQVNEAQAASTVAQTTKRTISFKDDISIIQAIENIIKSSSYITDAVNVLSTSSEQPNTKVKDNNIVEKNKNPPPVKWYNLSSIVEVTGFDPKAADFSYIITYVIQPYDTPSTYNSVTKPSPYYGPHKRYEYWFTGKNSEIIEYTQNFNLAYFQIASNPSENPATHGGIAQTATIDASQKRIDADRAGGIDKGKDSVNEYLTSLVDPESWSKTKISILGDPDYLMQDSPGSLNDVYQQFYGPDFSINPNGGEVFIEIDFKEAIDYQHGDGLLKINSDIGFNMGSIGGQNNKNKTTGGAFLLNTVTSTFQDGKFTQLLDCTLATKPYENSPSDTDNRNSENTTVTNSTPTGGLTVAKGSGYSVAAPVTTNALRAPALSPSGLKSVYGSTAVGSSLSPTGTFLDGRQRNLVNDDAALSVGAGTTQAGSVDVTTMSVNQRLSAFSQRVSAFFKPGTPPPPRAPGSVPGGVTRINPSDIQPM